MWKVERTPPNQHTQPQQQGLQPPWRASPGLRSPRRVRLSQPFNQTPGLCVPAALGLLALLSSVPFQLFQKGLLGMNSPGDTPFPLLSQPKLLCPPSPACNGVAAWQPDPECALLFVWQHIPGSRPTVKAVICCDPLPALPLPSLEVAVITVII